MVFLYPSFLWALAAVLVPVIIHLFNFRRYKKVYFSNVKFLKELQLESKSRSRLREILVLTARCLALAALVMAFCRPLVPAEGEKGAARGITTLSIYIDNSFSMENVNRQGRLLDVAKLRARELVKAFGESSRFHIVTNNFDGAEQRLYATDNALDMIERIKISPSPRHLSSVYQRQANFLANAPGANHRLYMLSDLQKSTFDLPSLKPDSSLLVSIIPLLANRVNNVYTDSCWFDSPVQQKGFRQRLYATVVNNGSSDVEAGSARLYLNSQQVALSTFSVSAGATTTISFSFWQNTEGFNYGWIGIEDYPITFDDKLFCAFNARLNIGVTLISGSAVPAENAFTALFGNDSIFSLRAFPEQAIDYSAFASADIIVLNQLTELSSGLVAELQKFASSGGGIVVIPPASLSSSYAQAMPMFNLPVLAELDTTAVNTATLDLASGFYAGVFEKMESRVNLPLINAHFRLRGVTDAGTDQIIALANGDDLLLSARFRNAGMYLFTSPLLGDYSNFSRHALFVPTFFRIALRSIAHQPAYYNLQPEVAISMRASRGNGEQPPHIIGLSEKTDVIPEKRVLNNRMLLFPRNQIEKPGFYMVREEGRDLLPLAFNYSRTESDLRSYTSGELSAIADEKGWKNVRIEEEAASGISPGVLMGAGDQQLWKLFIILALVFFLAECLLLRFLK